MANQPKEGDLRVWHIPQVPMKAFRVPVPSISVALVVLRTLANYDQFQLDNNIKPDYSNVQGLEVFEDGEWCEWYDANGDDIATAGPELAKLESSHA